MLIEVIKEFYMVVMVLSASTLITDVLPIAWVIRCHILSFKSSRLYSQEEKYVLLNKLHKS